MDNASKRLVDLATKADGNVKLSRAEGWDRNSIYLSKLNREEDELRAAGIL